MATHYRVMSTGQRSSSQQLRVGKRKEKTNKEKGLVATEHDPFSFITLLSCGVGAFVVPNEG